MVAEYALLVLRVYCSARGETGVPAARLAGEKNSFPQTALKSTTLAKVFFHNPCQGLTSLASTHLGALSSSLCRELVYWLYSPGKTPVLVALV